MVHKICAMVAMRWKTIDEGRHPCTGDRGHPVDIELIVDDAGLSLLALPTIRLSIILLHTIIAMH